MFKKKKCNLCDFSDLRQLSLLWFFAHGGDRFGLFDFSQSRRLLFFSGLLQYWETVQKDVLDTPGWSIQLLEAFHSPLLRPHASWFWAEYFAWVQSVPVVILHGTRKDTIFRVSLRQQQQNLVQSPSHQWFFAFAKRFPSSWNFFGLGKKPPNQEILVT